LLVRILFPPAHQKLTFLITCIAFHSQMFTGALLYSKIWVTRAGALDKTLPVPASYIREDSNLSLGAPPPPVPSGGLPSSLESNKRGSGG
jgi:hypothetical protein